MAVSRIGARLGAVALAITAVAGVGGCSTMPQRSEPYQTRLFVGTYEDVWSATLKALNDYPLKISNKDSGRIQSETVNGPYNDLLFTYPEPIELPERYRYTLKLAFAKLSSSEGTPLTRIRVIKELERFHDFYTGWLAYGADGMEERVLLYRIEHILRMERALSGKVQLEGPTD